MSKVILVFNVLSSGSDTAMDMSILWVKGSNADLSSYTQTFDKKNT